ncbi:MAG: 4Fe-4S cluster-binding domain-containing protein [Ruminococcus sp.]|nr:4Fe-4S cluster-binding domain-containing protein [Ruminococcus sp.]
MTCTLCPRNCKADRTKTVGLCGAGDKIKVAKAYLHKWEEPCISGRNGSGTVFFSGCNLKCCFCQNYRISHEAYGMEITAQRLSDIFLRLQEQGAENINLVSAGQFVPQVITALDKVKHRLTIPVVYNTGSYEKTEALKLLEGYIDIYLPDLKYFSSDLSLKYSAAENYFEFASKAVLEMYRQQPELVFDGDILKKGVVIRHLMLPKCRHDSMKIIDWIYKNLPPKKYLVSLMSQYTPSYKSQLYPEINRRISTFEYNSVLEKILQYDINGFFQEKNSADKEYIPDFDLYGI